jgi:hypothetical protein
MLINFARGSWIRIKGYPGDRTRSPRIFGKSQITIISAGIGDKFYFSNNDNLLPAFYGV